MNIRSRTPLPIPNADRIQKTRAKRVDEGYKRKELWVPRDLTRREGEILQHWIDDIVGDIRSATTEETGE